MCVVFQKVHRPFRLPYACDYVPLVENSSEISASRWCDDGVPRMAVACSFCVSCVFLQWAGSEERLHLRSFVANAFQGMALRDLMLIKKYGPQAAVFYSSSDHQCCVLQIPTSLCK